MADYLEIESLSRRIGELLRARGLRLATAESCTGGALGDALTNIAGSSDYYLGGIVAYANAVKEHVLGVPADMLAAHGAVSPQVAQAMAEGARRLTGSDLALSTTGIAGPGGGTPAKPVGLTYIGLATPAGAEWRQYTWSGARVENKRASVRAALEVLVDYLTRQT